MMTPDTNQTILKKIWGLMGNDEDEISVNGATTIDASGRITTGSLFSTQPPTSVAAPVLPAPAAPAPMPAPMPTAPAAAAQGAMILRKAMNGDVTPTLKGVHPLPIATGSE